MNKLKDFWLGLSRHIQIWRLAWQYEKSQPKKTAQKKHELEFLPAVLEIQETPASPIGRTMGLVILLLFVLAIIWASFGKIDIVAIAQGKIIPSDHSKIIQPLEVGVISKIYVEEGQLVKAGDLLIDMDSTSTNADQDRLGYDREAASIDAARIRALIAGETSIDANKETAPQLQRIQNRMLKDQQEEYRARMESAELMITQRQAALEVTKENIKLLKQTVPLLKEKVDSIKKMADKNFVSRVQYLEAEENYLDKAGALAAYKQQIHQNQAALDEAKEQRNVITAEFNKNNHTQLVEAEQKLSSIEQEVIKARSRTGYQRLTAPIDGVVQQLAVHTVGGVVTPAQQLMVIVPKEDRLEIEAWVENKDIGFVNAGQNAEIKVEAFPFTRYGVIEGQIRNLSQDSVALENIGYVYTARVSMVKSVIDVGNKVVNLSPGMTVSVEFKTGKRRLIEFFLSPLLRGIKETARER